VNSSVSLQVYPLGPQMHATVMPAIHERTTKLLAADVLFRTPLWRHYMTVGVDRSQNEQAAAQLILLASAMQLTCSIAHTALRRRTIGAFVQEEPFQLHGRASRVHCVRVTQSW
jgi:hypothetical protein